MSEQEEPSKIGDLLGHAAAVAERARQRRPEPPPPDPEAEERQRRAAAERAAEIARIRRERFEAQVPARFASARMSDLPPPRGPEIQSWLDGDGWPNLVLAGPVGCGKTHAAVAAARAASEAGLAARLISTVELLEELRPGGPERALERAIEAPLLVLDDLGAERPSDWTAERLALIIDRRWLDERPILATTNLSLGPSGELIEALGERSYSRLVGSGAIVLQLQGEDRRRR